MGLTAGIVGLPNVGKSTLFNAITQAGVEAANYPFATIDPNVGVVEVPDARLDRLTELVKPKKTVPTAFEFTDIAGIVKGASKGEGLGNKFLANIREVDAICQVVRCFEDDNITHVAGKVSPIDDITTINLELILADLELVEKRITRVQKMVKSKDKGAPQELEALEIVQAILESERPARVAELTDDQLAIVKHFQLLTMKPMLYVANVSEDEVGNADNNEYVQAVREHAASEGSQVIVICARIEEEISELEPEERLEFLQDLGIEESGLDQLIRAAYSTLGLATYFTAGEKEVRAWTFKHGMKAPQCAGVIHSDFERGFIRAEVVSYEDLSTAGNMTTVKEQGKLRSEGKEYVFQDGDVVTFRFNV